MNKKLYYLSLTFNLLVIIGLLVILVVKGPSWYVDKIQSCMGITQTVNTDVADETGYANRSSMYKTLSSDRENGRIVFLGDSLTANINWDELLEDDSILNRGIGGDTTKGILKRLDNIISLEPKKLFIMVGINDLLMGKDKKNTINNYDKILSTINEKLPNTQVYIQSILPINNKVSGNNSIDNKEIDKLNNTIKELSDKYKYTFIDIYPLFLDSNNMLKEECTVDGVHLNISGYLIWKNELNKYLN
jgi:lysophospholipase L1-like esterase